MTTKTITITEDSYYILARHKRKGESFSQIIKRAFSKKHGISRFIGAWGDMDEKEARKLHELVGENRRHAGKLRIKNISIELRN